MDHAISLLAELKATGIPCYSGSVDLMRRVADKNLLRE
jgi:hypothetical protein